MNPLAEAGGFCCFYGQSSVHFFRLFMIHEQAEKMNKGQVDGD